METTKKGYFDTDELCATCGKPMNDKAATEECMLKWVPPKWNNHVSKGTPPIR